MRLGPHERGCPQWWLAPDNPSARGGSVSCVEGESEQLATVAEPVGSPRRGVGDASCGAVLSPELVLVSPDLREFAIAGLPERDPYAFLVFDPPSSSGLQPEFDRLELLAAYHELLADDEEPQLRRVADFTPDYSEFLTGHGEPQLIRVGFAPDYSAFLAAHDQPEPTCRLRRRELVAKAVAYALVALTEFLFTWGFVVAALIAAATLTLWAL